MPGLLSQRLLPLLQLTRMALVFTAIADSMCSLLLGARARAGVDQPLAAHLDPLSVVAVAVVSIGLYGYGMSLNDLIDRRRDRQLAADRPLPSGRIGFTAAQAICLLLGLAALVGGLILLRRDPLGWASLVLVIWTGLLITSYDLAGKYLVAAGLLLLGLIRFFHAAIPAPDLPLLWHPLLLMNHIVLVSAVAYAWEAKRPPLTRLHWWLVAGGLAGLNAMALGIVWWRRSAAGEGLAEALWIGPALALPGAAVVAFVLLGWVIRRRSPRRRDAGSRLMLTGLLWLIVYDAAFVAGYVHVIPAIVLLGLLPLAYVSVQLMRWWEKVISLSQRPEFRRVEP